MVKKTKITILNQYFYPENITSATLPYELAKELTTNGYDVKALAGMPQEYYKGKIKKNDNIDGISIERIDYLYKDRSSAFGRFVNYFSFFFAILANRKKLRNTDILITYSSPPINPIIPACFSKRYGFRMVYIIYDLYPDMAYKFGYLSKKGLVTAIFNAVNKFVFKRCEKIVLLSEDMRQYFAKNKGFADKLVVIPNWYEDTGVIEKQEDKDCLNVLYGGNIGIVQDVNTLSDGIISLRDRKDIQFYFAVHGSVVDGFFEKIKNGHAKTVKNLGFLQKDEYDKLLESVDIAVVSLDSRVLGLASPSKFYSYISKGIPVIFIGSEEMDVAKEIIKYNIGFVVKNGDKNGLRDALLSARTNKSMLNEMGIRARGLFEKKYTEKKCAKQYVSVIKNIEKNK